MTVGNRRIPDKTADIEGMAAGIISLERVSRRMYDPTWKFRTNFLWIFGIDIRDEYSGWKSGIEI